MIVPLRLGVPPSYSCFTDLRFTLLASRPPENGLVMKHPSLDVANYINPISKTATCFALSKVRYPFETEKRLPQQELVKKKWSPGFPELHSSFAFLN